MSNIFVRLKLYHILEAIFLHKATDLTSTNNGPVLDVSFCRVGIRCQNPPKSARFHHLSRGPVDYIDIYVPALAGHGYISKLFVKPTKKQKKTSRFFFFTFSEVEPPSAVDPMLWMPIAVLWQNTQLQVVMDKNMLDVPQQSVYNIRTYFFCVVVVDAFFLKSASSSDSLMKMNWAWLKEIG